MVFGFIPECRSESSRIQRSASPESPIAPLTREADRLLVQEVTRDAHWDKLLITDEAYNKLLAQARG